MRSHPEVSLTGSNFEIEHPTTPRTDGTIGANLKVDDAAPSVDWASFAHTLPTDPEKRKADLPTGAGDDSFGQGTKEDTAVPSVVDGSIPPNKSDLKTFGVYLEEPRPSDEFLNLFWQRVQDPSGTTNMDFEFNQSATLTSQRRHPGPHRRRPPDPVRPVAGRDEPAAVPLRWARRTRVRARQQRDAVLGHACNLGRGQRDRLDQHVARSRPPKPTGSAPIRARTFGEAQINFDGDLHRSEPAAQSFGWAYLKSRSSDSFTSALKDFIAPAPTNISNCGTVIIRKQTDPDGEPERTLVRIHEVVHHRPGDRRTRSP